MAKVSDDTVVCFRQDEEDGDKIRRREGVFKASVCRRHRFTNGSGKAVATVSTTGIEESGTRDAEGGCLTIMSMFLEGFRNVQQTLHVRMGVLVGERAVGVLVVFVVLVFGVVVEDGEEGNASVLTATGTVICVCVLSSSLSSWWLGGKAE